MPYTILGARGFIGSHLLELLRKNGEEVFAPERDDPEIYRSALGKVIYAVGLTADFRSRPFDTIRAHVSLLAEVLEKSHFDAFLYLSSTRVYAGSSGKENAPLLVNSQNPSDLYNLSKLMGESLCFNCGHGHVKVARLSNVLGNRPSCQDDFLYSLLREARTGKITFRSDLESQKDYIHLDDVADLLPRILSEGGENLYNVASGVQTTHRQWAQRIQQVTQCRIEVEPSAPRMDFPPIDIHRIQTEFSFTPRSVMNLIEPLLATI